MWLFLNLVVTDWSGRSFLHLEWIKNEVQTSMLQVTVSIKHYMDKNDKF